MKRKNLTATKKVKKNNIHFKDLKVLNFYSKFKSIISKGPKKAHLIPRACFKEISISSIDAYPSSCNAYSTGMISFVCSIISGKSSSKRVLFAKAY